MIPEGLQAQLNQYVEQQNLLLTVTRQIAGSAGLDEIIPHILGGIDRALQADVVRLLVTASGSWRAYAAGPKADVMASVDEALIALVGQLGEVVLTPSDHRAQPVLESAGLSMVIALPLVAHTTPHGMLWLGFAQPRSLVDAERTLLSILAGQAAIAIANAQSFAAARKRREWLAAVLASTPDPVLVVDRDRYLQLINPAAQAMFPHDAVGLRLDDVPQMASLLELFVENGAAPAQPMLEYTNENKRTYSLNVSDVHTESGEMTGWVLVLRDITHFRRLNDNMSEFLSTVSHDMRSPLTFMKGYLDMLGMIGELNERQTEFVFKITAGVNQMADMVEKILEAGKLDPVTGNYQLAREACDLIDIVRKMMSGLVEPAAKKDLTLNVTIDERVPVLNVDRAMMTSALTNLVENAVKYTPEGGQVDVSLVMNGDELIFRVSDDGFGISPENQAKLFARNVRVHRKEWKRVKGSGLGLFIVKNVAQRHGGDAWVESVEGEGSTFCLSIPLEGANLLGGQVTD